MSVCVLEDRTRISQSVSLITTISQVVEGGLVGGIAQVAAVGAINGIAAGSMQWRSGSLSNAEV